MQELDFSVLGQAVAGSQVPVPTDREPLAIEPKTDLYGGLLFQGPRFQRMGRIYELDSDHTIFASEARAETGLLGEAFADGSFWSATAEVIVTLAACVES